MISHILDKAPVLVKRWIVLNSLLDDTTGLDEDKLVNELKVDLPTNIERFFLSKINTKSFTKYIKDMSTDSDLSTIVDKIATHIPAYLSYCDTDLLKIDIARTLPFINHGLQRGQTTHLNT